MLRDITNEKLIVLNIEASDWEDAIRKAAQPLVKEKKIKPSYVDAMINVTKEAGPYIVITKGVALPHARPENGSNSTSLGIATLKTPIKFGNKENDPVKYIFCLSAIDSNSHLKTMEELVELLDNPDFYKFLDSANNPKQVLDYIVNFERKGGLHNWLKH